MDNLPLNPVNESAMDRLGNARSISTSITVLQWAKLVTTAPKILLTAIDKIA